MITFITLDNIITDLLNIIRGAKVTQSETITRRQVEEWVNEYRALLIKQDLDKGKMPNPDYIQEIPGLLLEVVDLSKEVDLQSHMYQMRTILAVPKTVDLNFKAGLMYVGTIDGREIQLVPEGRAKWQQYKRFTANNPLAFLRNGRIYINSVTPLNAITVRGVFQVPTEVGNFINPNSDVVTMGYRDAYPIPSNMVPVLKEMILSKELGVMAQSPSDNKADGNNAVSLNAEPGYAPQRSQ
jgi:hypothetical protein